MEAPRPTPTCNRQLVSRIGGFSSLPAALDYAAQGETGLNLYSSLGQLQLCLSYTDLRRQAMLKARHLSSLKLARGSYVALIGETSGTFFSLFFACQYAGLVPCVMPYNTYPGGKSAYAEQLRHMLSACGARLLIAPDSLVEWLVDTELNDGLQVLGESQLYGVALEVESLFLSPDESAYVQFSSGSTSDPKGVLISQKAVCDNIDAILHDGMNLHSADRAFSWLPMYHDMGLVGFFLAALCAQCSVDYLSPISFAKRPSLWLQLMSDNRSSITYAPAFAYRLALHRLKDAAELDLSNVRIAGIGGELIRPGVLEECSKGLEKHGFQRHAWLPSYGLAENCLAVCIGQPGQGFQLSHDPSGQPSGRVLMCCGKPLPGSEIRILSTQGEALSHGQTGHIWLRSSSLMDGYLHNARLDRSTFDEHGFIDTGDLGYWHQDQVVISGRSKELIQLRGRNVWPQDIEWALERVEPLTPGDVAAFAIVQNDEEHLVVLVQSRLHQDEQRSRHLLGLLSSALSQHFGISAKLHLLSPRSLPLTSSGKLSRVKARDSYLRGEYTVR